MITTLLSLLSKAIGKDPGLGCFVLCCYSFSSSTGRLVVSRFFLSVLIAHLDAAATAATSPFTDRSIGPAVMLREPERGAAARRDRERGSELGSLCLPLSHFCYLFLLSSSSWLSGGFPFGFVVA